MKAKRILILLLLVILCCGLLPQGALAESTQEKKVVVVLMDDSTSMECDNTPYSWTQGRYALQALSGMLNPGDEMRVYYLNEKIVDTVNLTASGIQSSLNTLSTRTARGGNTYIANIKDAYDDLTKSIARNSADTRHYLVVITDGRYQDASVKEVVARFESYTAPKAGQDKHPLEILYCTIGSSAYELDGGDPAVARQLESEGIYCYRAGDDGILDTLNDIADRISGRSRFTGSSLKKVNDYTLQVQSGIPLFNFVVLCQGSSVRLTDVTYGEGRALNISRQALMQSVFRAVGYKSMELYGGAYTVDNGSNTISAGTYTLTFNGPVDVNTIAVLFEPAVEVRLTNTDLNNLHEHDPFEAQAAIYEYGTNSAIPLERLPAGSAMKLTITADNTRQLGADTGSKPTVKVDDLPNARIDVRAVLSIPGFRDITREIFFQPLPEPQVLANLPDNASMGIKDRRMTETVEQLKHREKHLDFKVTVDGAGGLSANELKALGIRVTTDLPCEVEYLGGGTLRLTPTWQNGVQTRDYTITLHNSTGKRLLEQATVSVTPSTYAVKVSPEKKQEIKEAKFRDEGKEFTFSLVVDGKTVDASQYDPLTFSELSPGNPVTAVLDGKKWKVTASYAPGMALGDYTITASLNGVALQEAAQLTIVPSAYAVSVSPETITRRQSELEKEPLEFRASLKEDKKTIDPAALTIDWGGYPAGTQTVDAKKNELVVTLPGDLATPAGTYPIRVSYVSASGTAQEAAFTLEVQPSDFDIQLTPDRTLLFNTPDELQNNSEAFRFDILVDGRALTDREMDLVTSVNVEPGDTDPRISRDGSAYTVVPRASSAWVPAANSVTYTITCAAGSQQRQANYQYTYVNYEVQCVSGSGLQITQTDLPTNTQSLRFRVLANGAPLDYNTVNGNFTVTAPKRHMRYIALDSWVESDGTIVVTPTNHDRALLWSFKQIWVPRGDMPVTVSFRTASDQGTVTILPGSPLEMLLPYLIAAAILILLCGIIFKKRFSHRAHVHYLACKINGSSVSPSNPARKNWNMKGLMPFASMILPFIRESKSINGMRFRATRWGSRKSRERAIEYYVGGKSVVYAVSGAALNEHAGINMPDPRRNTEPVERGWHSLLDGDALIMFKGKNAAIVYKYKSKR